MRRKRSKMRRNRRCMMKVKKLKARESAGFQETYRGSDYFQELYDNVYTY